MCKLLWLLLLLNGFYGLISDPFVPFLTLLDGFHEVPGLFELLIKILFVGSGVALLFNYQVRRAAIVLGITLFLALLASKPLFRNHIFICGCIFFLSGVSSKDRFPWLLFVQLSVIYLGAFLNKVLQADWWSGQFMHNWLTYAEENRPYMYLSKFFPDFFVAQVLSWTAMGTELFIGVLLWFRKWHKLAVWLVIIFHTTLFTLTIQRFGHFFEDILIFLMIFLNWPKGEILARFRAGSLGVLRVIAALMNWDRQIQWNSSLSGSGIWLELEYEGKKEQNMEALRSMVLYSPGFYFILFVLDPAIRILFLHPLEHWITSAIFWAGILFFIPVRWTVNPLKGRFWD